MGAVGGGIFALRRPRPYSRAFAGRALRPKCRGLKPILPFLEGRSDAACRVVIRLHASHPWDPHGFYHGTGRVGTRRWAGKSSRKPRRPRPYRRAFARMPLRSALRSKCRPLPPPCAYHATHGDVRFLQRRVATVFEIWNFLIETYLRIRRKNHPRKIDPLRAFRRGPLFGIRWSKTYSPIPRRT